jgi:hypothetical protein
MNRSAVIPALILSFSVVASCRAAEINSEQSKAATEIEKGGSKADYVFYPCSTYYSYAFGKKYTSRITEEMLRKAPQWLEKSDNPPLSPRKALQSADALSNKLIGKKADYRRYLEGVCLKPMGDGWVWIVRFEWLPEGASTGVPDDLIIVVLMNGTTIQPEVRDWKHIEEEITEPKKDR